MTGPPASHGPHAAGAWRPPRCGPPDAIAAAMLKHTTFLGMPADVIVIKNDKGNLLTEVVAPPRSY